MLHPGVVLLLQTFFAPPGRARGSAIRPTLVESRSPLACAIPPMLRDASARLPPFYLRPPVSNPDCASFQTNRGCPCSAPFVVSKELCSRKNRPHSDSLFAACDLQPSREIWPHLDAHSQEASRASRGIRAPVLPPHQPCPLRVLPRQRRPTNTPPLRVQGQAVCVVLPEPPAPSLRIRPICPHHPE